MGYTSADNSSVEQDDQEQPIAFSSLRSKFEALAAGTNTTTTPTNTSSSSKKPYGLESRNGTSKPNVAARPMWNREKRNPSTSSESSSSSAVSTNTPAIPVKAQNSPRRVVSTPTGVLSAIDNSKSPSKSSASIQISTPNQQNTEDVADPKGETNGASKLSVKSRFSEDLSSLTDTENLKRKLARPPPIPPKSISIMHDRSKSSSSPIPSFILPNLSDRLSVEHSPKLRKTPPPPPQPRGSRPPSPVPSPLPETSNSVTNPPPLPARSTHGPSLSLSNNQTLDGSLSVIPSPPLPPRSAASTPYRFNDPVFNLDTSNSNNESSTRQNGGFKSRSRATSEASLDSYGAPPRLPSRNSIIINPAASVSSTSQESSPSVAPPLPSRARPVLSTKSSLEAPALPSRNQAFTTIATVEHKSTKLLPPPLHPISATVTTSNSEASRSLPSSSHTNNALSALSSALGKHPGLSKAFPVTKINAAVKMGGLGRPTNIAAPVLGLNKDDELSPRVADSPILPPPARAPRDPNVPLVLTRSREPADVSSSDDETDLEKNARRPVDDLPDSSKSNRRHPLMDNIGVSITVPAYVGVVAVSGDYCCVAGHGTLTIHNLSGGAVTLIDLKDLPIDWRVEKPRITAMEFRSEEAGRWLWCGTRDGCLMEVDTWTGELTGVRPAAHGSAVAHIFRVPWEGKGMMSLDENGKSLIFSGARYSKGDLGKATPRVQKITDKQVFAKMLNGRLWTSNGSGASSGATNVPSSHEPSHTQRGRVPVIRVYDFAEDSGLVMRSLTCNNSLGPVTSGTMVSSTPGLVYLGHEGGSISIWQDKNSGASESMSSFSSLGSDIVNSDSPVGATDIIIPVCISIIKVSFSDVLALEGVSGRLWAGGRKGHIYSYDVTKKPWVVTNIWKAHGDLPILKLAVDPFSIVRTQRLLVYSIGRDETVRFWDGALKQNWIENTLRQREPTFCSFRDLNALVLTWNVDAAKPEALVGEDNSTFLQEFLASSPKGVPDIISFGFQEVVNLEDKKLAAKTVILGGAKNDKLSSHYRLWVERLTIEVQAAYPHDQFLLQQTETLVGLLTCIFIRKELVPSLRDIAITTVKCGMGGMYGNKGAIIARLTVDDSSICFVNCHLAAGQAEKVSRNADLAAILEDRAVFPNITNLSDPSSNEDLVAYVGGGDGSMVLDHELCILNGDLNYRIDRFRDTVISAVKARDLASLLHHDQLLKEMRNNTGFRLRPFHEAPIHFAPTYKYDRKSKHYDTSEKRRTPAWCDRILFRSRDSSRIENISYRRYEPNVSDHRPVCAVFRLVVKKVSHQKRKQQLEVVKDLWGEEQLKLLIEASEFYGN